jgi:hypothetical protein
LPLSGAEIALKRVGLRECRRLPRVASQIDASQIDAEQAVIAVSHSSVFKLAD